MWLAVALWLVRFVACASEGKANAHQSRVKVASDASRIDEKSISGAQVWLRIRLLGGAVGDPGRDAG